MEMAQHVTILFIVPWASQGYKGVIEGSLIGALGHSVQLCTVCQTLLEDGTWVWGNKRKNRWMY